MSEITSVVTLFAKGEQIAMSHVIFLSREGETEHQSGYFPSRTHLYSLKSCSPLNEVILACISSAFSSRNTRKKLTTLTIKKTFWKPFRLGHLEMLKYIICILPFFPNPYPDLLYILQTNVLHFVKD